MGTHPIFESDFDCLTEMSLQSDHSDDEIENGSDFISIKSDLKSTSDDVSVVSGHGDSMETSAYEMIKSNFEDQNRTESDQEGSTEGSTDESVSTSELPELIPIEKDSKKEEKENVPDP